MTSGEQSIDLSQAIDPDPERDAIVRAFHTVDSHGERAAAVFRETFDQLYDGQRTGRYRWDQLFKTEKTHFGTLLEINLRREFDDLLDDGDVLDYRIHGEEIDCKYSQRIGGWMLPPECFGRLLLVASADDARGEWSLGIVRATDENRRPGANRDAKSGLNKRGLGQVSWVHFKAALPPNVLLTLDESTLQAIFESASGQARINELLRRVNGVRIGRNTIATVAMQADYMKRVRYNGGARSRLREEGFLIPGGDYEAHRAVAAQLGVPIPNPGEVVSVRVVPAGPADRWVTELDGRLWRLAQPNEPIQSPAPLLPDTRRQD